MVNCMVVYSDVCTISGKQTIELELAEGTTAGRILQCFYAPPKSLLNIVLLVYHEVFELDLALPEAGS